MSWGLQNVPKSLLVCFRITHQTCTAQGMCLISVRVNKKIIIVREVVVASTAMDVNTKIMHVIGGTIEVKKFKDDVRRVRVCAWWPWNDVPAPRVPSFVFSSLLPFDLHSFWQLLQLRFRHSLFFYQPPCYLLHQLCGRAFVVEPARLVPDDKNATIR